MIRFKNQKLVTPIVLEHFKDLGEYIMDKFFNVNFKKKMIS